MGIETSAFRHFNGTSTAAARSPASKTGGAGNGMEIDTSAFRHYKQRPHETEGAMAHTILLVFALVLSICASARVGSPHADLGWAAFACWIASMFI